MELAAFDDYTAILKRIPNGSLEAGLSLGRANLHHRPRSPPKHEEKHEELYEDAAARREQHQAQAFVGLLWAAFARVLCTFCVELPGPSG